jgi:hypothetical protein
MKIKALISSIVTLCFSIVVAFNVIFIPAKAASAANIDELTNQPVLIENQETKRYLFSDGSAIKGNRGAEGGWKASSGFESPNVVGADANYYNRALWKIIPQGNSFLIENQETKRYAFADGPAIKGNRGDEGGWKASSGFESPNVVGADANYYNRALWKIIPQGDNFLIENQETKRYLFSDGPAIKGNRGAEGGWKASPNVVGADANYYNRALWKIIPTSKAASAACDNTAQKNLAVNGSFEKPVVDLVRFEQSIEGWQASEGGVIELGNQNITTPSEGSQFVELDSNQVSKIEQNIPTQTGKTYKLSFAFSPRPGTADNKLNVRWGDTSVVQLDKSGEGLTAPEWKVYSYDLKANSASTRLSFDDLNEKSDGLGSYLDAVSVQLCQ